jgi:hypothetical protein
MKKLLKLAVLALAGTAALALAGNALAKQKLTVQQTATSVAIKASQDQSDAQPARISIYVPSGYTLNTSAAPGTTIGTTSGNIFARDANISLPVQGDVVVVPPTTNAPGCDPVPHLAVWNLALSVAGQNINLPVHVDQLAGAEAALGSYKLVVCLAPDDVPQGTPGRSPNGARLLDATFKVNNVFTVPAGANVWKAITTPYAPSIGAPNPAGTVETRALVGAGAISLSSKLVSRARREVRLTGVVSQGGAGVAGAQVRLLINGKLPIKIAGVRTNANGAYSMRLRRSGKKTAVTFQTRVVVGERDVTSTVCSSPTPGVPGGCVSATASGFTAISNKKKIKL